MAWAMTRWATIGVLAFGAAVWAAGDARADGLTFLPDPPAGVFTNTFGGSGAATTTDGSTGTDSDFQDLVAWTVSPSHLEIRIDQRTRTDPIFPIPLGAGSFVFTVDTPCTYSLAGHYAYYPEVAGTSAFGYGYAILNLKDATENVYLFGNVLDGAASSGTTFQVGEHTGDPTDYLAGSLVGTLWPGHVYVLDFWVQTVNFGGGPAVGADALFRLDVEPFGNDELASWTQDIADSLAATPLAQVTAPNAKSAAGRLASLVQRLEQAADAIAAGDLAAAKALLGSVRDRIDGVSKPEDWLVASAEQAALLAEVDALLAALA